MVGTITVLLLVYFLPSIISYGQRNHMSVVVINFFLGWTLLGWVIALAMAVSNNK